jgi:hypothetical protein
MIPIFFYPAPRLPWNQGRLTDLLAPVKEMGYAEVNLVLWTRQMAPGAATGRKNIGSRHSRCAPAHPDDPR